MGGNDNQRQKKAVELVTSAQRPSQLQIRKEKWVKLVPIHLRFCLFLFFAFLSLAITFLYDYFICSIKIQFAFETMVFSFMVMKQRLMLLEFPGGVFDW